MVTFEWSVWQGGIVTNDVNGRDISMLTTIRNSLKSFPSPARHMRAFSVEAHTCICNGAVRDTKRAYLLAYRSAITHVETHSTIKYSNETVCLPYF